MADDLAESTYFNKNMFFKKFRLTFSKKRV